MARRRRPAEVVPWRTMMTPSSLTSPLPNSSPWSSQLISSMPRVQSPPIYLPRSSSPQASTPRSSSPQASTPQSSSPRASTPWTLSNNQNPRIPYKDLQEPARLSKNPELAFSVDVFFTYNGQLLDMYEQLKKIVERMSKGGTFTSCRRDVLATSFEQMVGEVMVVLANQQHMLESQKRYGATLDAEVDVKNHRKDDYYTICASMAALFGACVFFAVKLYPESLSLSLAVMFAFFAAVASAVFYRAARLTDTYQDQLMVPVKKRKDMIEVIIGDNKLALYHLTSILASINDLQSQVEPILKMVDSRVAMGSNMLEARLEAFNLGFQKLVSEVDRCSMDAYSSRQGVVQTINKTLH